MRSRRESQKPHAKANKAAGHAIPAGRFDASSDRLASRPSAINAPQRMPEGFQSDRKFADALDECGEFGIGRGLVTQEPSPQSVVFAVE